MHVHPPACNYFGHTCIRALIHCCLCGTTCTLLLQLSGRAGRNGSPSVCLMFTNRAKAKSCKDEKKISFSSSTRTCQRRLLLNHLEVMRTSIQFLNCVVIFALTTALFTFSISSPPQNTTKTKNQRKSEI